MTGQLWYGGQGSDGGTSSGSSDNQVGHIDSDQAGRAVSDVDTQDNDAGFQSVGLDTSAGIYFALDGGEVLRSGHITNDTETNEASQFGTTISFQSGTEIKLTDDANQDEDNVIAVDPVNHVIYTEIWGKDDDTTAIIKISYNTTTGVMTSPYNSSTGVLTAGSNVLMTYNTTGGKLVDVTAMSFDIATGKLYYIDDDLGYNHNFGANQVWGPTKNIYVVDTTVANPSSTLTQLTTGMNATDTNTYISGFAVDDAKGIIYYAINTISTLTTQIFWMPITGGAGTAMSIPGGVSLGFEAYFNNGSNAMTIDQNSQTLYVGNTASHIVQLTLSADGHSFTAGNSNFEVFDANGNSSDTGALLFDNVPILTNIVGTTTEAVQGGSAITLLAATPGITDKDNVHLGYAEVVIANAQAGDVLSATASGGISVSYNSTTHVLTLSGDASFAAYQTLLNSVQFQDTGTDNGTGSHPTRTLDWIISDGTTLTNQTTADSNEQTTTVVIDRAPTLTADNYNVVEAATVTGTSGTGGTGVLGNDNDKDGDAIVVTQVNGSGANVGSSVAGTYGHLTLNSNGSFSYIADNATNIANGATGSHLTDTFTYTVSDGLGGVTTSTVTVTLDRVPTVVADAPGTQAVEAGSPVTGNVLSNDSDRDGDSLTVSAVNGVGGNVGNSVAGTYGHITIGSNGSYSYSADNTSAIDAAATGSHLTDSFTYTANDGHGGTTTTTITVTVDRPPTVVADNSSSDAVENSTHATGNVLTNDSDRDADSLTVSQVNGSAGNVGNSVAGTYGHITIGSNGSYDYTADNIAAIDGAATGSHLTDTFTYQASDGHGGLATQTVTITLDRAPTVVNDNFGSQVAEGGSTGSVNAASGVLANDSDRDGDSLTVSAVGGSGANVGVSTATSYGHITLNADGSYTYNADNTAAIDAAASGSHPTDVISFTVSDGLGGTTLETLSIAIDRPAVANADSLSTTESTDAVNGLGGNQNLLANDVDKDGDAITITQVNGSGANVGSQITLASGALLTVNADGTYTYDPNHAFDYLPGGGSGASNTSATDSFSYTVDGGSQVTVTVTINGVDSNDTLIGTTGNDTLSAGIGDDIIYDDNGLNAGKDPHDTSSGKSGGTDTFNGGSGNDKIYMGGNLTASDQIDGGTNTDTVNLNGDYSAGLVFNATTMVNVEVLQLVAGHSYNLTMNNATVTAGQTLTVQGGTLGASDQVTFDASADTTGGNYVINAGAGNDTLTGGIGNDVFNSGSGTDTIHGNGGNDTAYFQGNLTAADTFDGGSGDDTVSLNGDYSAGLTFTATTLTNVERITLKAGHNYNLTIDNATVTAGSTLTLAGNALHASDSFVFDGSNDTSGGRLAIYGGAGNDTLTGGWANDIIKAGGGTNTITGGGGSDILTGGSGADTFVYNAVSDSTSTGFDKIRNFDASTDFFHLTGTSVTGVDTAITSGRLAGTHFDSELATDIGAAQLAAHHAVLFTADSGNLAGHTFLVVDINGTAGYQAGQDIVIDLTGGANLSALSTGNFI